MKSALDPNRRLKSVWKAVSSEETQTLSLCQSRVPGDGILLAHHLLSRRGVGPPPLPRLARQRHGAGRAGCGCTSASPPHAVDHPWDTAKARPRWNRGFLARTVEAGALRRGAELDAAQAELWPVTLSICVSYTCATDQASEMRQLSSPGLPDEDCVTSAVEIGSLRLREAGTAPSGQAESGIHVSCRLGSFCSQHTT